MLLYNVYERMSSIKIKIFDSNDQFYRIFQVDYIQHEIDESESDRQL